uniref:Uncharacterized protein n=1 Tax=Romanomermis culicivorax TaxID=13658 RepID=A0A915HSC6_ROMCU
MSELFKMLSESWEKLSKAYFSLIIGYGFLLNTHVCNDGVLIPRNHAKYLSDGVNTWEMICNTFLNENFKFSPFDKIEKIKS